MNGAVEAANKVNWVDEVMYKDWHDVIRLQTLITYPTLTRTSTGATPFPLVYESEAILPIELEILATSILLEYV